MSEKPERKKRTKKTEGVLEQIALDFTSVESPGLSQVKESQQQEQAFLDPTKIMATAPLPEKVKRDATDIFNEVINVPLEELVAEEVVNIEVETSASTILPVKNKMILSYEGEFGEKLTFFDREVVDAIATLAPHTQVISATTIFRVISGNREAHVTTTQRQRVEDAMEKCGNYKVEIDITNQYLEVMPQEAGNVHSMNYSGRLISFEKLRKKATHGSNTYYKILGIPPVFRYAEAIGKVSVFPLALLGTPIKKTEQVIVLQSYLLREIGKMKQEEHYSRNIFWESVYSLTEVDSDARQLRARVRGRVIVMLDFWVKQEFIEGYASSTKRSENYIKILL